MGSPYGSDAPRLLRCAGKLEVDAGLAVCADGGGDVEVGEGNLSAAASIKNGEGGASGEVVLNLFRRAAVLVDQDDSGSGAGDVLHLRRDRRGLWVDFISGW